MQEITVGASSIETHLFFSYQSIAPFPGGACDAEDKERERKAERSTGLGF